MDSFLWIPGKGMDAPALARLQEHFLRPKEPMGEAWFMGERQFYPQLLGDLSSLRIDEIEAPLAEISSGTGSFGPSDEWNTWYHYLLARTLPRALEAYLNPLLESLITGFIAIYPNGVHSAPYKTFREDTLLTLGRCLMDKSCWEGSEIAVGRILHRSNNNLRRVWCWWDASGDFSSSMFFCLKYLPEALIGNWLRSVLAIKSPHWRAQVLVWMVGAHGILAGKVKWPSELKIGGRPSVSWEWSHCLGPVLSEGDSSGANTMQTFLRESVQRDILELVRLHFSEETYLEWLDSISRVTYLYDELAEIPSMFEELYVHHGS